MSVHQNNQIKMFKIYQYRLLNDLTKCYRHFNVDIIMLYISATDHARTLKLSSYVHLPSINKIFQYRYA